MVKPSNAIIVTLTLLLLLSNVGCHTVKPQLQDEYIRNDLSDGMLAVIHENRQSMQQLMIDMKIPGLSLALVDRDGMLWAAGLGYSDRGKRIPMTTETLSAVCSFTKVITGTAVMFAIQDGLVDLDVPIIEYIPDFSVNSRFEENPQEKITLRHLLTHSSGFPRDTVVGNSFEVEASFENHIKSISKIWLCHKVGERLGYSNIGMGLVAHVLQVRTGKPYAEFIRETIFKPLDMLDSSADLTVIKHHPKRATWHKPHVKEISFSAIDFWRGAGSVFMSAQDLARFIRFHLNRGEVDGGSILDEKLIDLMYTALPLDGNPWPEHRIDHALGIWVFTTLTNGNHKVGHPGVGGGFTAQVWWYPEYGFGGFVMARSPGDAQQEGAWLDQVMKRIIAEKLVEKNKEFDSVPWKTEWNNNTKNDSVFDPNSFTPYQPAWKKYTGTYRYRMKGFKLNAYARLLMALFGFPQAEMKVYERNGYLEIVDGGAPKRRERLDEHQPGLFFTEYGACLDLRGKIPTWNSYRLKKIK